MKTLNYLLFPLILLLAACSSTAPPPAATTPLKISIQSIWPTYGAAFIAQEKGFFAKYGVQVTLLPVAGYMESLKPYKEGQVDGAFMVFADAITFNAEGVPTCAVYATEYSETGDLIVGRPTLNSLSDLKGKTVSFEGFNTFSHMFVAKLLEKAGVAEGEFKATNMEFHKLLEALETGKIDAGHVIEPTTSQVLAKGYKVLGKAGEIRNLMMGGLTFKAEVVKQRPTEVQGVVKALVEGMEFLRNSPEEGFTLIAKFSAATKPELEASFKRLHVLNLQENQAALKKGGPLFEASKEIVDFFYKKGGLVKIPDLNAMINGQFVEAVDKK